MSGFSRKRKGFAPPWDLLSLVYLGEGGRTSEEPAPRLGRSALRPARNALVVGLGPSVSFAGYPKT